VSDTRTEEVREPPQIDPVDTQFPSGEAGLWVSTDGLGNCSSAKSHEELETMKCDVAVVGCGVAGLSAAIAASEKGARVIVLERSPKDVRGGNSRYSDANFRMSSETEISDDFEESLVRQSVGFIHPKLVQLTLKPYDQWPPILKAYGFTDPELISAFSDGVPYVVGWLKGLGIGFLEVLPFISSRLEKRIAPSGGGEALVETLAEVAERKGVTFLYETTARSLIQNKKGEIRDVKVWSNSEGNKVLNSRAVILASGGFQGNLEMMVRYMGHNAYFARPVAPGGLYNKGEGIEMALEVGAAPAGQYDSFHATPTDPRSGLDSSYIFTFNYGILVNQAGKRFIDEGSGESDVIYAEVARATLRQPGGKAYLIHDSKIEEVENYRRALVTDRRPVKAGSIEELASKLEIDRTGLEITLREYNRAVQEEGHFDPLRPDGKRTRGLEPPKSNWARTINEKDLMAFPVMCDSVFTFGGIKTTPNAEVLNRDGYPITGLYAAGEMTGWYYGSDVGSTSVLRGLVFGRKAGDFATEYVRRAG